MADTSPINIRQVFVQARDGVPSDEAFFKAWDGFRKRQVPCQLFEPAEFEQARFPIARDTLVAGAIRVVEAALARVGGRVPTADNLPACLAKYRGRKVWPSTWGELRARYGKEGPPAPLFVKPRRRNKGFPSIALYNAEDMSSAGNLPDSHEVLVAEYVLFDSEWRCFVCRGQILGMYHYLGDPFRYPDAHVISSAIEDFGSEAPAGYGIDFGVLSDGRTVLVEVNDGYSLAPYGLNSTEYSELIEARWIQLVGPEVTT